MLKLGKYEIVKRLAKGGMAEIFLARASGLPGFQRMVVVKRILPVLACKADFLEMFLNEARIAATLQHPNVVQMYDVGVVDGDYFIAMEYLHGEDVRSLQNALHRERQRMPLEHVLQIVIGVCAGLHYAHEKLGFDGQPLSIVHRDVSPQNVIVTFDGGVKLLDFGVAKAASNAHETRCGVVKGKIPYMSPEQCRGAPLDRRSDLYSVGIILYELTLGRRLYSDGTEFEILKRIAERPVTPPRVIEPDYDERLEHIVMRALAKDPARRYQTARALQMDLEDLARQRGMYMSAISLSQFMAHVFGDRREAWRDPPLALADTHDYSVEVIIEHEPDPPLEPARRSRAPLLALAMALLGALVGVVWHGTRPSLATTTTPPAPVARAPLLPTVQPLMPVGAPLAVLPVAPLLEPVAPLLGPVAPLGPAPVATPAPQVEVAARRPRHHGNGTLMLNARPWCEVIIDGAPRGATPSTVQLSAGSHKVRVTNAAFNIDESFLVQIESRQVVRRSLSFR
jgi:serine/threonine protein kinase